MNRKIGEEIRYLLTTHLFGMSFIVENDIPVNPIDIRFFGTITKMI